jgi:DNA-binding beta-propeller fold protein YncE
LLSADEEDPPVFLYSWGEYGSDPGQFDDPGGIAVGADGKIYVADTDNHRIQVLEGDGTPLVQYGSEGSGSGQFQYPKGIAVDSAGNIFVADTYNHRIVILSVEGTAVSIIQQLGESNSSTPGQFSYPSGIAVTSDGATFYVADTYNHRIQVFTWDANDSTYVLEDAWGDTPYGTGPKEFTHPEGVAVTTDGSVYVADTGNGRIQKFTAGGAYSGEWGAPGPTGLTIDADGNVWVAASGSSCIQKFTSGGAFIMTFGQQGSGNYRFNFARDVAIATDNQGRVVILVADTGNHCIKLYRPASYYEAPPAFLAKWGASGSCGDGDLCYPVSIAIDDDGYVFVGNANNNRVQKFTAGGGFLSTWGSYGDAADNVSGPNGLSVDTDGDVYVTDQSNHRIHRLAYNGSAYASVERWGSATESAFYYPAGVAVDSQDNVYVADQGHHRIQKYDIDGATWTTFAGITGEWGAEDSLFNHPYGIAIDRDRDWLYVSDYINHRIKKYDLEGTLLAIWGSYGSGAGEFDYPFGLAVDHEGNVYVADYANHRIQKFNSDGGYLTQWGSEGSENGQFSYPYGVAVHPNGTIYVCDSGNNRIQVFGEAPPTVDLILDLKAGWNMVSVPVVPADASRAAVFPPAQVVAVYTWNPSLKSYVVPDTIAPEVGYWVALTEDIPDFSITGTPVTTWPSSLITGWNMVGSVYGTAVSVNDADAFDVDPSGSVLTNAIYWWNPESKSYVAETSIVKGQGYWMAATVDCDLTMTAPTPP